MKKKTGCETPEYRKPTSAPSPKEVTTNLIGINSYHSTYALANIREWQPWSGSNKCPNCGGSHIEVNTMIVLTTYPAQSQLRCQDCGHCFGSGTFSTDDTLDTTASYPDITLRRTDSPVGWVCSKCGRSWAPHIDGCVHCNNSGIKITY